MRRRASKADSSRSPVSTDVAMSRRRSYNVSSGRPFTYRELADAVRVVRPGPRVDLLPGRRHGPGSDPYLDITRLTRDTGFIPAFDLASAVADYVAWRATSPR
jgi:nucleoside-diphosphate-sugar epimerase